MTTLQARHIEEVPTLLDVIPSVLGSLGQSLLRLGLPFSSWIKKFVWGVSKSFSQILTPPTPSDNGCTQEEPGLEWKAIPNGIKGLGMDSYDMSMSNEARRYPCIGEDGGRWEWLVVARFCTHSTHGYSTSTQRHIEKN